MLSILSSFLVSDANQRSISAVGKVAKADGDLVKEQYIESSTAVIYSTDQRQTMGTAIGSWQEENLKEDSGYVRSSTFITELDSLIRVSGFHLEAERNIYCIGNI